MGSSGAVQYFHDIGECCQCENIWHWNDLCSRRLHIWQASNLSSRWLDNFPLKLSSQRLDNSVPISCNKRDKIWRREFIVDRNHAV